MKRKGSPSEEESGPNKKQKYSHETPLNSSNVGSADVLNADPVSEAPKKDRPIVPEILRTKGLIQEVPALDPPSEVLKEAVELACKVYHNSHNLKAQQELYGDCIKSPLPTSLDGSMELNLEDHYLLEDVDNTEQYRDFEHQVRRLSTGGWKYRWMGVVVQASGCGKTHFAKVFTRKNRAIYLNFAPNSSSYNVLVSAITTAWDKIKPRDFKSYTEFTKEAQAITRLYFTCAFEYYGEFLFACADHLKLERDDEAILTWIGSLAFSENNIHLFHALFEETKNDLSPEEREQYIARGLKLMRTLRVQALFCDEITSLSSLFVGQFLHEIYPREWKEDDKTRLLQEEQNGGSDTGDVFKKPTSLSYLILSVMRFIEAYGYDNIASVGMARSFREFEIEVVPGCHVTITDFDFLLKRNEKATFEQFVELVKAKFGDRAAEEWRLHVPAELAARGVYLSILWTEVIRSISINHGVHIQKVIESATTKTRFEKKAEELLNNLPAEFKYEVLYSAVFHNGVRYCHSQNREGELGNDFSCIPSRILFYDESLRYTVKITDKHFIDAARRIVTQPNSSLLQDILTSEFTLNGNFERTKTNALMRALALINNGKRFSELAVAGTSFPEQSIANSLTVDVQMCGDDSDFGLEPINVMLNPIKSVEKRLVVPSKIKPDGLSISQRTIVAWGSKYQQCSIGIQTLQKAIWSLDPSTFSRKEWWLEALEDCTELHSQWFDRYVRVIIAKSFSVEAIHFANTWNAQKLQHPVILVRTGHLISYESPRRRLRLPKVEDSASQTLPATLGVIDQLAEGLKEAVETACKVYHNSHNLKAQQELYGDCIKSPLPTSLDGSMELNLDDHYLLEDADRTQYQRFVEGIYRMSRRPQDRQIGAVVKASGCGKTHFAKVFTRKNGAIYLNFAPNSSSYNVLVSAITTARDKIKPCDFKSFTEFTEEARAITQLYFTCAIDYYGEFLFACVDHLKNNDEVMLRWIGSLAFSENNIHLFHTLFEEKKHLSPKERKQYIERVRSLVQHLNFDVLFCDEITSLSSLFVGQFLHQSYPLGWTEEDKMQLLHEEQNGVRDATGVFNLPTSLLYLVITKNVGDSRHLADPIRFVALTSNFSEMNFYSAVASPQTMAVLERDEQEIMTQFVALVKDKFGDKVAEDWVSLVPPELAVRSAYLSCLWTEIVRSLINNHSLKDIAVIIKAKVEELLSCLQRCREVANDASSPIHEDTNVKN